MFAFNDVTYRYLLIPLSKGYLRVVPDPVRTGIGNFFYNLKTPIYVVNHLLQGNPRPAGRNLLRFGINATSVLFGLLTAAAMGLAFVFALSVLPVLLERFVQVAPQQSERRAQ